MAGGLLQRGQSLVPCWIPDYHAKGGESVEGHAEGFLGSLEAVSITFIHILLSKAQSHGPTEPQKNLGNVVFLCIQERNDSALLNT